MSLVVSTYVADVYDFYGYWLKFAWSQPASAFTEHSAAMVASSAVDYSGRVVAATASTIPRFLALNRLCFSYGRLYFLTALSPSLNRCFSKLCHTTWVRRLNVLSFSAIDSRFFDIIP